MIGWLRSAFASLRCRLLHRKHHEVVVVGGTNEDHTSWRMPMLVCRKCNVIHPIGDPKKDVGRHPRV